jgi:hypothetical protein
MTDAYLNMLLARQAAQSKRWLWGVVSGRSDRTAECRRERVRLGSHHFRDNPNNASTSSNSLTVTSRFMVFGRNGGGISSFVAVEPSLACPTTSLV